LLPNIERQRRDPAAMNEPIEFFSWFRQVAARSEQPWLVLGKGPSFSRRSEMDLSGFSTLGLNHVVREHKVTIAHAIDVEVVEQCADELLRNCNVLVMPWVPHLRYPRSLIRQHAYFGPGRQLLPEYLHRSRTLARLNEEGRLLWYNLGSAPKQHIRPESPVINSQTFSSVAALGLLSKAGVRRVRTLGIDGGVAYSQSFQDMTATTKLQTGQTTYSTQFKELAGMVMKDGLDFAPLGVETPIRVFVGTEPEQDLAFRVLRYSIKKNTAMSVLVEPLFEAVVNAKISIPTPTSPANRPRTPFSFQRFAIPRLKNWQGRAIYLDSDMLVFADLRELWIWPTQGNQLLAVPEPPGSSRRPQFSVMLLDCEALYDWKPEDIVARLDAGQWTYEQLLYDMGAAQRIARDLPLGWNDLERYSRGSTKLLHFTDMDTQPWLSARNPFAYLWCSVLLAAIADGEISIDLVRQQVRQGWLRPSLLWQVENQQPEPALIPRAILLQDVPFVPVHRLSDFRTAGGGARLGAAKIGALLRVMKSRSREVLAAIGVVRLKRAVDRHI
jgi:hypothetical protein